MAYFGQDIPGKARWYIALVTLAGLAGLVYSLQRVIQSQDPGWLALAGATLLVSLFSVVIPSSGRCPSIALTASDVFIFSAILIYSPEAAVMVALVDGAMACRRSRMLCKALFNVAQNCLITLTAGYFFLFLMLPGPGLPLTAATPEQNLIVALNLGLSGMLYFAMGSGLVAGVLSLVTGGRLIEIWRKDFRWISLTHLAAALAGVFVFLSYPDFRFLSLLAVLPLVAVIYSLHRQHRRQSLVAQPAR